MLRRDCEKEIDILIRARYVLVYVVTYEESKAIDCLKEMASQRNKEFFVWSSTQGIHKPEESTKVDEATRDPINALNHIERQTYPAIFVMLDLHRYLDDNTIVRKLRDLVENLKQTYETLIILSPVLNVPVELEKDVAVVDFDLPDQEDLNNLFKGIKGSQCLEVGKALGKSL